MVKDRARERRGGGSVQPDRWNQTSGTRLVEPDRWNQTHGTSLVEPDRWWNQTCTGYGDSPEKGADSIRSRQSMTTSPIHIYGLGACDIYAADEVAWNGLA